MARFEYTRTITDYQFTPPEFISEQQFDQLQMQIKSKPEEPLIDEKAIESSHDKLVTFLMIGIIALLIGIIGMFSSDTPPAWACILVMICIFLILHPIVNMGILQSSKNSLAAEKNRIKYFRDLKNLILESESYAMFIRKYRRIF